MEKDYQRKHRMGGRPPKLSVPDKLMIMLQYYREYRAMDNIAFDYGVSKSTISDAVKWVEEALVKDGTFHLPSKRKLIEGSSIEVVLVDTTECEINRPQKKQRRYYSGKKKKHTLKLQIFADTKTLDIICIAVSRGKTHDFNLLTAEEKAYNRMISKRRIYIEHINRYIKRFRILSSRYRNQRKRFALWASLICGIYNFQH